MGAGTNWTWRKSKPCGWRETRTRRSRLWSGGSRGLYTMFAVETAGLSDAGVVEGWMAKVQISVFGNHRSNEPVRETLAWPADFSEWAVEQDKLDAPCWSPALYEPAALRDNDNVQSLTALVLDHDHAVTIQDAERLWNLYEYVLHTSFRHTEKEHRFRIVLPYARPVTPKEHRRIWRWANEAAGGKIDPQCKDPARIYFVPVHPPGATPLYRYRSAEFLDPDEILESLPIEIEEEERTVHIPDVSLEDSVERFYVHKLSRVTSPHVPEQGQGLGPAFFLALSGTLLRNGLPAGAVEAVLGECCLLSGRPWKDKYAT